MTRSPHRDDKMYWVVLRAVSILTFLSVYSRARIPVAPLVAEEQLLWVNGIADVHVYRCPLLTYTPQGNLLAIAEGRKTSGGDASSKFIAARRSTDGGYEWSKEALIYDDGPVQDGDNLGAILVDDDTSTIFLFFTLCPHHVGCNFTSMMYITSVDDGVTWSKPVNLTTILKDDGKETAFGPGRGIQLKNSEHKGRLLACGHQLINVWCIYSDDHGETWQYGLRVPSIPQENSKPGDFALCENQPEELSDGTVMLNSRNHYNYHCKCRIVVTSKDGGETISWTDIRFDTTLIDPVVSGHILAYQGILFFSNPATTTTRTNMTLRWSYDDGTTWSGAYQVWNKASGYSCMTALPKHLQTLDNQKYIYLLYEKGDLSATETVSLVKISLDGTL